jgi:DNA-binding CsgD family transcriptional regulator
MPGRTDAQQVPYPKLLQALGKACGVPLGIISTDPNELAFATVDMDALLEARGLPTRGSVAAEWLLNPSEGEGVEIGKSEVTSGAGRMIVVSARPSAPVRLKILIQRMARRYGLSPSEQRELDHLGRGLSIKDSAQELGLSPETVRVRRKRVYRKMGLAGHEALLARLCYEALVLGGEMSKL